MSYSKIVNRQIVNLSANLAQAAEITRKIPVTNLRFVAHEVIVRQISYSCTPANQQALCVQISLDLALDLIIGSFPLGNTDTSPNTTFFIKQNFQAGDITLQFQNIPAIGTGSGTPITAAGTLGQVSIILEFIKYG